MATNTESEMSDSGSVAAQVVYVGDSYRRKKDPEHLQSTNGWQRAGDWLRTFAAFFAAEESFFGLKCACATMTVGVLCYLENGQVFFQEQRLMWAMIIIAIGMSMSKFPAEVSRWSFSLLTIIPHSVWRVNIWPPMQSWRHARRHGHELRELVHCGGAYQRRYRLPMVFHLHRVLLGDQVSPVPCRHYHYGGHADSDRCIRAASPQARRGPSREQRAEVLPVGLLYHQSVAFESSLIPFARESMSSHHTDSQQSRPAAPLPLSGRSSLRPSRNGRG